MPASDRIVRLKTILARTGLSRSTIYRKIAEGTFPAQIRISLNGAGWRESDIDRWIAKAALAKARFVLLSDAMEVDTACVGIGTMHEADGLEFKACAMMACADEVIPRQSRTESVADDADLEDVYETERHLLYVACTRARDQLLATGVEAVSDFLEDLWAPALEIA
jgi:predicted DNA-binding transcriptional regulator AlpA